MIRDWVAALSLTQSSPGGSTSRARQQTLSAVSRFLTTPRSRSMHTCARSGSTENPPPGTDRGADPTFTIVCDTTRSTDRSESRMDPENGSSSWSATRRSSQLRIPDGADRRNYTRIRLCTSESCTNVSQW